MTSSRAQKLLTFIRHAPSRPSGFLYGRYDADIATIAPNTISFLRAQIIEDSLIICSPATRCLKTCDAVLSKANPRQTDDALWEQSFGTWDGTAFSQLPDIGILAGEALADFTPPDGESFSDLCGRVHPIIENICLNESAQNITFFVHAGVIRAALSLAFSSHKSALSCEIDPLSVTRLRYLGGQGFSVVSVNRTAIK